MPTLKQVLIAITATAVSNLASPLFDATPTSIVGAPQTAVTGTSKPLEGKELEDFLANGQNIPEGAIDITNTTLAAKLIALHNSYDNGTGLVKRGACDQGACPDFNAPFDLYQQHWVIPMWGGPVPLPPLVYWAHFGRWNDCGQCQNIPISGDGCFDFTGCGRPQNVCIDTHNARAHRIWKDTGDRGCWTLKLDFYRNCGPELVAARIWHPDNEVPCTW
ncbi:hypothetical protein HJFPF1_12184 [Paramyrothecium foliicola]|nr:hypothetical protein HJFPF1_12184 [Paramyrothecium foliicola]